ncbi:m119.3 protein [Murid betaherpesvirus 1]|nr:m119.3 protein [Murid betaherpesvirus 1]
MRVAIPLIFCVVWLIYLLYPASALAPNAPNTTSNVTTKPNPLSSSYTASNQTINSPQSYSNPTTIKNSATSPSSPTDASKKNLLFRLAFSSTAIAVLANRFV